MNLLAIDTTLGACSAAIYRSDDSGEVRIKHERQLMDRGHAENLMPMIERLSHQAELDLTRLDRIAVTSGPGTFTGVRIGIAAARGLALATGCQIFHETSLRVIALGAIKKLEPEIKDRQLVVAMDARRGEIYLQIFDSSGLALTAAAARMPSDAIKEIDGQAQDQPSMIVGSAIDILREAKLGKPHMLVTELKNIQPCALELARLAANANELTDHVSPLYLRAPDAKPQTGKSILRKN